MMQSLSMLLFPGTQDETFQSPAFSRNQLEATFQVDTLTRLDTQPSEEYTRQTRRVMEVMTQSETVIHIPSRMRGSTRSLLTTVTQVEPMVLDERQFEGYTSITIAEMPQGTQDARTRIELTLLSSGDSIINLYHRVYGGDGYRHGFRRDGTRVSFEELMEMRRRIY